MVFWLLAIAITVIACAALYYASSGRGVNAASGSGDAAVDAHFRLQLREIGSDLAAGRLPEAEGKAAKRELAREYVRLRGEQAGRATTRDAAALVLPASLVLVAGLAFGTYGFLGRPDLPAQPLAGRPEAAVQGIRLEDAVARIEQQLTKTPDDLRGWRVIAPAYLQLQRFADAERAYRRILELAPATADAETDLAEALLVQNGGNIAGEPLALLRSAAALDPAHVRSRFYLAGESTRIGDFAAAKAQWTELLVLAKGDEAWVPVAKEGLSVAEAGLADMSAIAENPAVRGMVEGLSERLMADGGTIEEWTQLVRSRLVLKERDAAQAAYDAAVKAYPDPGQRAGLDALAKSENLAVPGAAS